VQCQCAAQQRLSVREVAQFVAKAAEVTQVVGERRIVGAQLTLPDLNDLLELETAGTKVLQIGHARFLRRQ
jgi:hypothetical protein